jgi:hypothetical protein
MTDTELETIRAVIRVLREPRNKFGAIQFNRNSSDQLHLFVDIYTIPHGGYDSADKAQMILAAMIGDKPISVLDI